MMIDVYWNSHKKLFSVRKDGKVTRHVSQIMLCDCVFKVSKKGRERVLREQKKNVHAFVSGHECYLPRQNGMTEIYYNPYEVDSFVVGGCPISSADYVWFSIHNDKPVVEVL
jgi:hypothetical protein